MCRPPPSFLLCPGVFCTGKARKQRNWYRKNRQTTGKKGLDTESIAPTPPIPPGDRRNVLKTPCLKRDVLPTHTHTPSPTSFARDESVVVGFCFYIVSGRKCQKTTEPQHGIYMCMGVCVFVCVCRCSLFTSSKATRKCTGPIFCKVLLNRFY